MGLRPLSQLPRRQHKRRSALSGLYGFANGWAASCRRKPKRPIRLQRVAKAASGS